MLILSSDDDPIVLKTDNQLAVLILAIQQSTPKAN